MLRGQHETRGTHSEKSDPLTHGGGAEIGDTLVVLEGKNTSSVLRGARFLDILTLYHTGICQNSETCKKSSCSWAYGSPSNQNTKHLESHWTHVPFGTRPQTYKGNRLTPSNGTAFARARLFRAAIGRRALLQLCHPHAHQLHLRPSVSRTFRGGSVASRVPSTAR